MTLKRVGNYLEKKPGECQITKMYVDPLNRGFLLFFSRINSFMIPSYRDTDESENEEGINYVGIVPSNAKKLKEINRFLGLFDENLDVVWWAEKFVHEDYANMSNASTAGQTGKGTVYKGVSRGG